MDKTMETLRINEARFRHHFDTLAKIGKSPEGGLQRSVFSEAHCEVRRWFLERGNEAGLATKIDGAGNHSIVLSCGQAGAKTLLLGSHLDAVPNGGQYDGALGVLAGLEALLSIKDAGLPLSLNVEAIDFTDEEGIYLALLGSRALTGLLTLEQLHSPRGDRHAFEAAYQKAGLTEQSIFQAKRDPDTLAGYLELHIEQGGRLIDAEQDLGIVTGIVGIRSYRIRFKGRANHAGTTPMDKRFDAALGASAFTLAARDISMQEFPGSVVNVGNMIFDPGVFNIVPELVTLSLECRTDTLSELDNLEARLLESASHEAERFGLEIDIQLVGKVAPAPMSEDIQQALVEAGQRLGLRQMKMTSGAGHDAQSMATVCPTGMIFVPSVEGISHAPQEFTEWEDCVNGANVLLQTVIALI